jgi:3-oxoadipate enol-lactonase
MAGAPGRRCWRHRGEWGSFVGAMLSRGPRALGYEDRGAGAPVVLLHPFPFSRGLWAGVAETLAVRHRVLAVDARGFGESPLAPADAPSRTRYEIAELADDLAALLDQLEVARAAVVGMSMGGYTALAFAARHPARLSALALADTRAAADSAGIWAARDAALALIAEHGSAPYLAGSLARLLSPAASAALVAHLRARAESRPASLVAAIEALRDRPDRTGELGAIACPTLVICGAEDQVTPAAEMRLMADAIPGASFVAIPDAGHLAHVEAPGAFERALTAFLAANSLAADSLAPAMEGGRS